MERHNHNHNLNQNAQDTQAQLTNIRNMIRLTTDNLSKLNERFAGFKHPPQMYINEYEQLTTKLDEFQCQEQKLMEQLSEENPSDHEQDNHYHSHNSDLHYSPLDHQQNEFSFDSLSRARVNDYSNLNDLNSNLLNNSSNTPPTPKSPYKSVVRAHLPNNQRTTVPVSLVFFRLFPMIIESSIDFSFIHLIIFDLFITFATNPINFSFPNRSRKAKRLKSRFPKR